MFGIGDKLMDILNDIFSWIYESFIEPFLILHSFENLIYGQGRTEKLIHKTFTSAEITDVYQAGSTIMFTLAGFFILTAIIIAGVRISSTAINPGNRTYYLEFLKDLAIVMIIFFNLDFLYDFIFRVNNAIVGVFAAAQEDAGLNLLTSVTGSGIIGSIFVGIIVLFLMLWANWYYMMRKLTLLILMILGPLMLAIYLIPQYKGITVAWLKELAGTIFVQSIHACLFWIVSIITVSNATDSANNVADAFFNIETVILYLIFIPTGEAVRSLLGMGGGMHSNMSRAGAMFGMSALAGVYGSVKGALNKDTTSVMSAIKDAKDKATDSKKNSDNTSEEALIRDATQASNTGTNSASTPDAEGMLKWWDVGSKAGKAVFGAAGSIGGAAIGGPMGAMTASSIGFATGGVVGGITGGGSKALKDLAEKNLKEGKNSFTDTWNEMKDPLKTNQEALANELANKDTADYENEFKPSFVENAQKEFPDLDEAGLKMKWDEHKKGIHAENLKKARKLVQESTGKDGKQASAESLAKIGASEMTNRWANENKEAFDREYDSANPLPQNATTEEKQEHEANKAKAWNSKLKSQQDKFQNIANHTAEQLKEEDMGSEMINKNAFAKSFANNLQENDKLAFLEEYKRHNPTADVDEAQNAYSLAKKNNGKSNFVKEYMENNKNASADEAESLYNMAQGASSRNDYIKKAMSSAEDNHKSLMEKSFDTALPYIENNDEEGFIEDYQSNVNPSASVEEARKIYRSAKNAGSKQLFMKNQKFTDSPMMKDEAGKDYDLAQMHSTVDNKDSFVRAYQAQNPNATKEQAELLFDKANSTSTGGPRSYLSAASEAVDSVKPESVFNKGANKSVNRGYLVNQLAAAQTLQDKENFINEQVDNGVPESTANKIWTGKEKERFQSNLSHFDSQLPQEVPMKQMIRRSDTMQKAAALGTATGAFLGHASGITPIAAVAKNVAIKGSLASQSFKEGYSDGLNEVMESPDNAHTNNNFGGKLITQTKALSTGIVKGIDNVASTMEPAAETAVEKQKTFRNAVAYTGGIIGGVKLYQKAGNLASRINPYNKVIDNSKSNNNGVYEASEIRQMASRQDSETGQSYIPQGNIQLVSTPTQSYVQATDSAGQKRIVSRLGAGDSALKKGQVVYQDLTIDDRGGLKPVTDSYIVDTGGAKVSTGRNININPNKLVATNRREAFKSMPSREVSPYNAKVETGTFSKQEAIEKTENIRVVVTKNQSYMVAKEKGTGREVRISPINQGDARLDANDVREISYTVKNKRFNVESIVDNNGKNKNDYTPRIDADEYLHTPRNPRLQRREQFERERFKKIGGVN